MFTRIVLAYNHTSRARRALEAAVQMAREDGGELIAVAVERSLVLSGRRRHGGGRPDLTAGR